MNLFLGIEHHKTSCRYIEDLEQAKMFGALRRLGGNLRFLSGPSSIRPSFVPTYVVPLLRDESSPVLPCLAGSLPMSVEISTPFDLKQRCVASRRQGGTIGDRDGPTHPREIDESGTRARSPSFPLSIWYRL